MKRVYWIILFIIIILLMRGCYTSYKETEMVYNTKQLEIYTMFAPSVELATVLDKMGEKVMTVIISKDKFPMDFGFTTSRKDFPDQVCSHQVRYNFPVGLKEVIVLLYEGGELKSYSSTTCKSLKVDAVSSASSKT